MSRHGIRMAVCAVVLCAGCDDDETGPGPGRRLRLNLTGVDALTGGFHYEGWAILNGQPVATGKFNVGTGGTLVDLSGRTIANNEFVTTRDLRSASALVITIERAGDTDALPSDTKYLAGAVTSGAATLAVAGSQALGNDFMSAAGKYILATPTTTEMTDESSGVWFVDLVGGNPARGLTLPTLPTGWKYEGWAVISTRPVTTGPFRNPSAADESAPFSGPAPGPPFPGEDFIRNAPTGLTFPTNLSGGMVVISIEPDPDDSAAPFTLKPLIAMIPPNAMVHFVYNMTNQASGFPRATATIQ